VFAILGFIVAGYLVFKKESKYLWIPLVYFSLMETLQAVTYIYIGDCSAPMNQLLTFLSYIHIALQPIFMNILFLYFIPARFRKKILGWVIFLSFIFSIFLVAKVYPFEWASACAPGDVLCAQNLCSFEGNWHLAWNIPLNDFGGGLEAYYIATLLVPLIYGSWRVAFYVMLLGPALARLITEGNPHEWPAVWCLMSIAFIFIIFIPWVRRILHVRKWYFWEYPHKCGKCKHWWFPKNDKHPMKCPKCKSRYWHK